MQARCLRFSVSSRNMRPDFKKVSDHLERLELYASQAHKFNIEEWPHLKNESGGEIYRLGSEIQRIYGDGRDCAVWMSSAFGGFYDVGDFPTLKSFVDSFEGEWVYQTESLEAFVAGIRAEPELWQHNWGIGAMLDLYERQIRILKSARDTLETLKDSNLYRKESGLPKKKKMGKQNINIHGATNVQIGDYNQQQVIQTFTELIKQIEESDASADEKANALSKLKDFVNLPLVSSVVGGALGGLIDL